MRFVSIETLKLIVNALFLIFLFKDLYRFYFKSNNIIDLIYHGINSVIDLLALILLRV